MGEAFELIQARGGLDPGSPPQTTCDACNGTLDPDQAVEVTITIPARVEGTVIHRLYGHATPYCKQQLLERVRKIVGR